jgi:phospholipid-binding lipoprotein MlaA
MACRLFLNLFFVICVQGVCLFSSMGTAAAGTLTGADFLSDEFYEDVDGGTDINDPLEPLNRAVFDFNDKMYFWVMEPVASVYSHVVPLDLRGCIHNFFWNLTEPVRFLNTLLQGRFADAGSVLLRFTINSTLGVYGLGDPAGREFNLSQVEATLGGTFARWGVGDGFYLVVPLHGPSTLRDFTGTIIDGFGMTPYYTWTDDLYVMGAVYAGKETNNLSMHLGEYEELKDVLFDPYVSFRNGYLQLRREKREFQGADPD